MTVKKKKISIEELLSGPEPSYWESHPTVKTYKELSQWINSAYYKDAYKSWISQGEPKKLKQIGTLIKSRSNLEVHPVFSKILLTTPKTITEITLSQVLRIKFVLSVFYPELNKLFSRYKGPLALKYEQLLFKDDYGDWDESEIIKEYKNFLSRKEKNYLYVSRVIVYFTSTNQGKAKEEVSMDLISKDTRSKQYLSIFSIKELEGCLEEASKILLIKVKEYRSSEQYVKEHSSTISLENLSPLDYEKQVADSLEKLGWSAKVTKASGDQGCDVLANKKGVSVAIQCKYYSRPVGNKAVQEIGAARSFYNTKYAAVVSNQSFTPSAKILASSLKVALLHHSQLNNLLEECLSVNSNNLRTN